MKIILSLVALVAVSASLAFAESPQDKQTAAGRQIGTSATQKIAFHGATPVVLRTSANQAAVTATVGIAVVTTAPTQTTPYGYTTSAQAAAVVTNVNALRADVLALTTLCNELRAALVEKGLIKGS